MHLIHHMSVLNINQDTIKMLTLKKLHFYSVKHVGSAYRIILVYIKCIRKIK